ncbi:MAG: hypothetical protein OXU20_33385 [Myxococcales bacterium]|nr:hypothetical protein [Myxococcales bacterium]
MDLGIVAVMAAADSTPQSAQGVTSDGPKGFLEARGDDLDKVGAALAKRDDAKLREALGDLLSKLAREGAVPALAALGFGSVTGPAGAVVAGFVVRLLMAKFECWLEANSADKRLEQATADSQGEADRDLLLRDLRQWLSPTLDALLPELDSHRDALLALVESSEQQQALLEQILARLPEPLADTLVGVLRSRRLSLPPEPSPAQLLDARYGAVQFHKAARASELALLHALCDEPGERIELQLLIGPGGVGKTRLLMHFCEVTWGRTDEHWHAGYLPEDLQDEALPFLARSGHPALVIIDHAEGRGLGPWLKKLLEAEPARKLRLVLLARHAGEWWDNLARGDAAVDHLRRREVVQVRDVPLEAGAREVLYTKALAAMSERLSKPHPAGPPPRRSTSHATPARSTCTWQLSTLCSKSMAPARSQTRGGCRGRWSSAKAPGGYLPQVAMERRGRYFSSWQPSRSKAACATSSSNAWHRSSKWRPMTSYRHACAATTREARASGP